MRLLFINNLYPPVAVGGYERLCNSVADGMASRGHRIHVLTSGYGVPPGGLGKEENVSRTLRLTVNGSLYGESDFSPVAILDRSTANARALHACADWFAPDVVVLWNLMFVDAGFLRDVEHICSPTAFVLTDNWLIAHLRPEFLSRYFANEVYGEQRDRFTGRAVGVGLAKWVGRHTGRTLDGWAIFGSRFMQALHQRAGIRLSHEEVVHHGVPEATRPSAPPTDRKRLQGDGCVSLLMAGRTTAIKGVHIALDALPSIARALGSSRVKLTVLGGMEDQAYIERLEFRSAALGVGGLVEFAPPVAEDQLPEVFARHDVYLLPSLYEPFSLTLLAALAAGIPVVASNVGGNPEVIHDRRTGLLFEKGDAKGLANAVVALSRNGELRQHLSTEARKVVAPLTFERMLAQIEAIVERAQCESQ